MSRPIQGGAARWRQARRQSETDALLEDAHRHLARGHRDRARRVVKEALLTEMSLPEGLEVGRLLDLLDETQAAVDLFHTLLRHAEDPDDRAVVRAALLMLLGRYDEATEPLRFVVDRRPADAEAHLHLAQCLARSGQDADALSALRRARQVSPPWPDLFLELGRLALRLGAVDDARVALYEAWRLAPDERENALAIAAAWMRARRPDEALPLYARALEVWPDDVDVLVAAGVARAVGGLLDEAQTCLDRLARVHPRRADARRRLAAAIDEASGAEDSVVELESSELVSLDGSLGPAGSADGAPVPAGLQSVVPVPSRERRLGDVTTGEVEAALGTLDLDLELGDLGGDLGSYDEGPIPPPLLDDDEADITEEAPHRAPAVRKGAGPAASGASIPPPLGGEDARPAPPRFGPPPAAVPLPDLGPLDPGDSVDVAFDALLAGEADGVAGGAEASVGETGDSADGSGDSEGSADALSGAGDSADGSDDSADSLGGSGDSEDGSDDSADALSGSGDSADGSDGSADEPRDSADEPDDSVDRTLDPIDAGGAPADDAGRPAAAPAAGAPSGPAMPARAPRRLDDPPRLQADIRARGEDSLETGPSTSGAEAPRAASFALLGPPPEQRRRWTAPEVDDSALPPLMAFGSLSGDLSSNLDQPDPLDAPARPRAPTRSRRSTGSLPLLDPRRASGALPLLEPRRPRTSSPPPRAPDGSSERGSVSGSVGGSVGALGPAGSAERAPPPVRRRFEAPPGSGPTGPLPSLPQRQPFAEMAVGQGLTHRGGPPPGAGDGRRPGRSRRGDRERPGTTPGGPMPPPNLAGWGAAPRTDPLLTTSDALQRWRPPAPPTPSIPPAPPTEERPAARSAEAPAARSAPSLRSQTAILAGSQSVFWIPRMLRFMEAGHLSGAVGLTSPVGQGEVQFRAGRLTGASASNRPTLAQVLEQPERLRPEQRARLGDLVWGAQDGESLLDRLVDTGLFEAPNISATVIDQVFATVGELLTWNVGWFTLVAHGDPPGRPDGRMVKLQLAALLSGIEDRREAAVHLGPALRPARDDASVDPRLEARIRAQQLRVERAPDDERARLQLAQLLMRAHRFVEAIDVCLTGLSESVDQRFVKLAGRAIEGLAQHGPRRGTEHLMRVALCGRLGRVDLVRLLEMLGQERVTGTLRLMAHEGLAEIDLADGRLAGATNANTARLGDLMRASAVLGSDQIEALVARQYALEAWVPLGRLALEAGLIEAPVLRGLLQKQVRLALLESGRWRQAHFVFELGERQHALALHRDLDTDAILRDLRHMVGRAR